MRHRDKKRIVDGNKKRLEQNPICDENVLVRPLYGVAPNAENILQQLSLLKDISFVTISLFCLTLFLAELE
ncbi:hypothetical protein [Caryophanon tenue]|uniref:Uncharacterized protein n=1 Tax=Caryophanon tenue TaxID=33978 RepID=A0A1C0YE00_9BACL|nr:hypothetical protein [Caryophanon tenue]OCS85416.1 hypothetical protein A6M13_13340 [Caryophanon tenue]